MKVPTGLKGLDDAMKGGLPPGAAVLVYGPPFVGKEVFARQFLLEGMRRGVPGILLLTGATATDARVQLNAMDAEYPKHESQHLAHFVDAYSRAIGADEGSPDTEYVDNAMNLNALAQAVNETERRIATASHDNHLLVLDSLSTLVAFNNAPTAFRFLQVFLGRVKRAGATTLVLLDEGMHTDAEVQMFKHVVEGVVEFKNEEPKRFLRVQGLGVTDNRGWVEYEYSETSVRVTGSFAAGRIR